MSDVWFRQLRRQVLQRLIQHLGRDATLFQGLHQTRVGANVNLASFRQALSSSQTNERPLMSNRIAMIRNMRGCIAIVIAFTTSQLARWIERRRDDTQAIQMCFVLAEGYNLGFVPP